MLFSTEGMGLAPGHWIVPIANILENFVFLLTMILAVTLLVMGIIHLLIWKTLNDLELWSTASSLSPMDAMRGQRDKTALHKMAKGFENPPLLDAALYNSHICHNDRHWLDMDGHTWPCHCCRIIRKQVLSAAVKYPAVIEGETVQNAD